MSAQPDDRAKSDKILQGAGFSALTEAAGAIAEITITLQEQGFTRQEALYWSAVYLANLLRDENPDDLIS